MEKVEKQKSVQIMTGLKVENQHISIYIKYFMFIKQF